MVEGSTAGRPPGSRAGRIFLLRRKRFLVAGLVVLAALAYLMYNGFQGSAMYYLTVAELQARGEAAYGEPLRVTGRVTPDSISSESQSLLIKFTIADQTSGISLPVIYKGVVPDTFKPGADVVVEGRYTPEGIFEASTVLTKCPSRYVPAS